jgi:hypothetical protein
MLGIGSAAQNVANTSQKGSLLIFPKIDVNEGKDTIVRIGNDYSSAARVQCFWENGYLQVQDLILGVAANTSIWINARTGKASTISYTTSISFPVLDYSAGDIEIHSHSGELICFAIDSNTRVPISWNHLFGSAEIVDSRTSTSVYGYTAWAFSARNVSLGTPIGNPGMLKLTGATGDYDACPQYLTSEFLSAPVGSGFGTQLTLVPCMQDFRQDAVHISAKAQFEVWDENGMKIGDAWKCINRFFDGFLQDIGPGTDPWTGMPIGGYGGNRFLSNTKTCMLDNGRFRVAALKSSVCESPYYYSFWRDLTGSSDLPSPTPGLGIHWYDILGVGPIGSTVNTSFLGVLVKYPIAAYSPLGKTPATAGCDPTGYVKYDQEYSAVVPE